MNAFLVVYLCILISKAVINTVLKYAWQWSADRDEPWYNHRTEVDRERHVVSPPNHYTTHKARCHSKMIHQVTPCLTFTDSDKASRSLSLTILSFSFSLPFPLFLHPPPPCLYPSLHLLLSLSGDQGVHRLPGLHGVV